MTERDLLVDSLQRLNRLGLPYMLTGSMASNFWGVPRTTHDIDFVLAFERREAAATLLHKLYWNGITPSERQLGDAAGIVAVQRDGLDRAYLERWARELGVEDVLSALLAGQIRPEEKTRRARKSGGLLQCRAVITGEDWIKPGLQGDSLQRPKCPSATRGHFVSLGSGLVPFEHSARCRFDG